MENLGKKEFDNYLREISFILIFSFLYAKIALLFFQLISVLLLIIIYSIINKYCNKLMLN